MSVLANLVVKMSCNTTALQKGLKGAKGSMDKLTGVVKAGALAGGTALAGLGLASVKLGLDFEKSMAEVKTLLPDITEKAFGKMKDDVLDFSKEMGIATEKAVPALYQAISAGVPRENVMEFMTVASKAAIGGVTELETAVDGITSVVNAYGAETISAQKASDIMFTGVRLGKTTFDELSASLFNVIPTAVSLGISFEEVTGTLAALTAQGVPTTIATTQLRQAFVEASKSGTKLDIAIRELTGQGFGGLIAEGKTSQEVFQMLRESMPEQAFRDLFSSVEAMNAILPITGEGFDSAAAAIAEAGAASGATEAAFATMEETTSRKLTKAINALKVEMTRLGSEVLPDLVDWYENKLLPAVDDLKQAFDDWVETMEPTIEDLGELREAAEGLAKAISNLDISIGESGEGLGKFTSRNAALRIQIGMLTEVAEMWTALLEGRWLDALKSFVQVGLVPFQVGWETTRGVVATVIVGIARAVQYGLGAIIPILQNFVGWVNAAIEGVNAFTGKIPGLGDKMRMSTIPAIQEVNWNLEELERNIRGAGDAAVEFGNLNESITNPMLREFAGLNADAAAAIGDTNKELDDQGPAAGGAAGGIGNLNEELEDLEELLNPINEMFSIMAGNLDSVTSSIHGLLGIQSEEEAQLAADIAALELEIEKIDQLAGETVTLSKAQEDNLYWWGRSLLMKQDSVTAIEEEIKALERLKDIEGELSRKDEEKLRELKEERDALEDSIEELQGKIDALKDLAGSETEAGKAVQALIDDFQAQIDVLEDEQDEISATKKALGTFMDAQVEGRPTMDLLTGMIFAQGEKLGIWKGEVDKLSPALRDWYLTHAQTVFDIALNFNHLLLAQSLFVDDSKRLATEWADAWAEAGNAAFTSGASGGSASPTTAYAPVGVAAGASGGGRTLIVNVGDHGIYTMDQRQREEIVRQILPEIRRELG